MNIFYLLHVCNTNLPTRNKLFWLVVRVIYSYNLNWIKNLDKFDNIITFYFKNKPTDIIWLFSAIIMTIAVFKWSLLGFFIVHKEDFCIIYYF